MAGNQAPTKPNDALHFSVDAGLLFQLGEELVNRRSVALGELVKNAYDADATKVTISFDSVGTPGGTIVIQDDGAGMTLNRIRDTWMRIATTTKVANPVSDRYKRPRAGAKGIGRFAARRLAEELELVSVAVAEGDSGLERVSVRLRWSDFSAGKLVQDVPVNYVRERVSSKTAATGVTLRLLKARDAWSEDDVNELRADMLKLISPMPEDKANAVGDPGFTVEVRSEEFPAAEGSVGDQFLDYGLGILEGTLTPGGKAKYSLRFRGRKTLHFSPRDTEFPLVGSASFRIHYFNFKSDYFAGLPIKTRDAQRIGRDRGGVHVYMDRFRVPPYGDVGDDWLELDQDRARRLTELPVALADTAPSTGRPMLMLPGNNQLFGQVRVSRTSNPQLHQTLNRERFIENESFEELRRFVRLGINWLTVAYASEFATEPTKGEGVGKGEDADPVALIVRAREQFAAMSAAMPEEERNQVLQTFELAENAVREQREDLISELSMLRVLASTGTMIVVFDHQIMGAIASLRDAHESLLKIVKKVGGHEKQLLTAQTSRLERLISDVQHQGELLGILIGRESRRRRRRVGVHEIVQQFADAFSTYTRDQGISIVNSVPPSLKTPPMFPAELSAIVVNLLTNAFKAVRTSRQREILIEGKRAGDGVSLWFNDTGVGARQEMWEEYFKPFRGESDPDPILGQGTGLGLKIVRDFVAVYGGKARFVPPVAPWKTRLEVTLPEK